MARGAAGPQGAAAGMGADGGAGAAGLPVEGMLPQQWTASAATVAATLSALKESMAPSSTASSSTASPSTAATPARPVTAGPAGAPATSRPPLPTRRSVRAAADTGSVRSRRSGAGLFARLLTVRAFRSRHADARAASGSAAAVGELLDAARVHGVLTLHQRRVPGHRAGIEHLAISAAGICVVDVRHVRKATVELRPTGSAGATVDLVVGGRVMTTAAAATARRVAAVRSVLAAAGLDDVPVTGALCLVDGLLPLGATDLSVRGVHVLRPGSLTALVTRAGSLDHEHLVTLQEYLAGQLPACT